MTDNYGSDPNAREPGDQQDANNAPDDQWQEGDQPPVDDFADEGAVAEESATVSEESGIAEAAAGGELAGKKSSLMLPIAAGVGVILVLGAVLYWQFAGTPSEPSVPPPAPIAVSSAAPPPSPPPAAIPDVAPTTAATPPVVDTTVPASALPSNVAAPASVPAAPAPVALPPPTTPGYPSPQAIPSIPPSTDTGSIDQRVIVLSARVDEIQKSLDLATQQLSHLNNILAANPSGATAGAAPNSALEDRLNKLEQQLLQAQNNSSANTPALVPPPVVPEASPSDDTRKTVSAIIHKPKHSVKRKVSSRSASRSSSRQTSKRSASRETWVLRAATPDEAWVAKSESSKDLRRVAVGDQLPGIGRIRAIHQNGDNWVIEGSKGTIR